MTHLLSSTDEDNDEAVCGAHGRLAMSIDEVDCPECIEIWDDWCELAQWDDPEEEPV